MDEYGEDFDLESQYEDQFGYPTEDINDWNLADVLQDTGESELSYERDCPRCAGSGDESPYGEPTECRNCGGSGVVE
jgi:DnaJ-class molecular chaperone